jgi:hypothetical protein
MTGLADTARKHLLNIPGRKLNGRYIVFESDDWGSERIPSRESIENLTASGINLYSNPFNYKDSLETEEDLSALFEVLLSFKDKQGRHPVITANTVTSNPDFEKIKASGYEEYFCESTLQTYRNKQGCVNSNNLIKEGINEGLYHPQFHGREHLNVRQWLKALKTGNEILRAAFDEGIYGVDLEIDTIQRNNFMAAFDSNSDEEHDEYKRIIREGVTMFRDIFGYGSRSFIAPCFIWHPSLEPILLENGIKFIQGLPIQYVPNTSGTYRKIYHHQGEKNKSHQLYFVRNCFFEPALNSRVNWVEDCLRRMKIIFYWGKPAIIGTHRINFMGSLNEESRKQNLKDFSNLLKLILETWPDAEFTTTDKLGELYGDNS